MSEHTAEEIDRWDDFSLKLKSTLLTAKQRALVWKHMSNNKWFIDHYTDKDIVEMSQDTWKPPQLTFLQLMQQLCISRKEQKHIIKMINNFPPLEESFLVLPKNLKRLAKMTATEAVFEAKLEASVLKDSVIAKMKILFSEKRTLFLTLDYNIHKIAAEHFPDIPPIKTEPVKKKSAYNMFLNDQWGKEPEDWRRTISPEIFSWCQTKQCLWNLLPETDRDGYKSRSDSDKLRYRYEIFKCLSEGSTSSN